MRARIKYFPRALVGWLQLTPRFLFSFTLLRILEQHIPTACYEMASMTVPSVNGLTEYSPTVPDEVKEDPAERVSIPTEFKHKDGAPDVSFVKYWTPHEEAAANFTF